MKGSSAMYSIDEDKNRGIIQENEGKVDSSFIIKRPELLAPAGDLEKLKFAIRYGADAVYIGGKQFGLRAKAGNFTFEDMENGVDFAKQHQAKVFVATNIIAHNEDLKGAKDYFQKLHAVGVDAVIVADPALVMACRDAAPDLEIHISTQASITNWKTVKFWAEEGIPRVVLAREVSIEEIKLMKERVNIEIEAFIHGAMCISYSGRCVLSNHMTARDANRGGCAQSCRWNYDLLSEAGNEAYADTSYTMSSKDLSMVEHLPQLIDSGVDSLKIEGRMKSIHYIATVVSTYREIIDRYCQDPQGFTFKQEWKEEMLKAAQRSMTTGFYFGQPTVNDQLYGLPEKMQQYQFVGLILDYDAKTGIAKIQQRNLISIGDQVEFFGPRMARFEQEITQMWDENFEPIERAPHAQMNIYVQVKHPVSAYDMMRKRK
ncbi:peptidase U32 family protein [Caldalkalibacillus mannanilyticus]|uniref:peptidase U32 family protein n=1 Tax=Caldalkalibacillus mannanilyticus TaxID=1418 RepID=UPI001F1EAB61|nr:U32 family peptidase [Caldalkalibacillus mannanilyticus]